MSAREGISVGLAVAICVVTSIPLFAYACYEPDPSWGACSLSASNYSITGGQGTTLSWSAPDGWGIEDGMGSGYQYSWGTINGVGGVGYSGSATVYPSQSTTYTFTAHYDPWWYVYDW